MHRYVSRSKFWPCGSIEASLICAPHFMQGISISVRKRVQVGVGRGIGSIVSSQVGEDANATQIGPSTRRHYVRT
jgi:hypothetical protein